MASEDSPAVVAESVATESAATGSNAELAGRADGEADQNEEVSRLNKVGHEVQK